MSLLWFDSFDLGRVMSGTGFSIAQDWSNDWATVSTFVFMAYDTGHNGGQALVTSYSNSFRTDSTTGQMRVGFWGKCVAQDNVAFLGGWVSFVSGGKVYSVYTDSTGVTTLGMITAVSGIFDQQITVSARSTTVTLDLTIWAHYEVFLNAVTGEMSLYQNGTRVLHSTTMDLSGDSDVKLYIGNYGVANGSRYKWRRYIDDMYVTDGPALASNSCAGVSIAVTLDWYTGFAGWFRPGLIIEGQRYQGPRIAASASSEDGTVSEGANIAQQVISLFDVNPFTQSAWTQTGYDQIDSWGLCWGPDDALAEGEKYRVANMALSRLDTSSLPVVHVTHATGVTYFSGDYWSKSDDSRTFASLLPVPRDATAEIDDNPDSIFCSGPGCIFFAAQEPDTDVTVLETLGITFAEEYRVDYHDFVSIDGHGRDFDSYFTSGYGVYGQSDRRFQCGYLTVNYENTVTGACYIQGLWDYTTDPDTGHYSMRQQVYQNAVDGYKHRSRKLKIRGRGRALQLRVTSQEGKPFGINGWSLFVVSNGNV